MTDTFDRFKTALADRYTIEEEVGAGGMATVYLAHDLKRGRKVIEPLLYVLPLILLLSCAENGEQGVNINSLIELGGCDA